MPDATVPEILRTNLSSTVLTLLNLGIKNVIKFEFIEKPEKDNLLFALKQLFLLKAIDKDAGLTDLGREMNKFPLEPTYAKVMLGSHFYSCSEDMVILVSILSTENIWIPISPSDEVRYSKLENARRNFSIKNSDHLSIINVYKEWRRNNYADSFLNKNFLLFRAMKQARKIKDQLNDVMDKIKFDRIQSFFKSATGDSEGSTEKKFRRCLTEGFYMNSARSISGNNQGQYLTADEQVIVKTDRWTCFELSGYFPDWILYTDLSGSANGNKGIVRLASEIKVKWIEKKLPLLQKVDLERLELAGDPPTKKHKSNITIDQIESLLEQKRLESKHHLSYAKAYHYLHIDQIKEKLQNESKDDKIQAAKERMLARKRQKLS